MVRFTALWSLPAAGKTLSYLLRLSSRYTSIPRFIPTGHTPPGACQTSSSTLSNGTIFALTWNLSLYFLLSTLAVPSVSMSTILSSCLHILYLQETFLPFPVTRLYVLLVVIICIPALHPFSFQAASPDSLQQVLDRRTSISCLIIAGSTGISLNFLILRLFSMLSLTSIAMSVSVNICM